MRHFLAAAVLLAISSPSFCGSPPLPAAAPAPPRGRPAFGRVIDGAGQPVAGATVRLLPAAGAGEAEVKAPQPLATATSDRRGRFTVAALPVGRVDLALRAPRCAPALVRGIAVSPGTAPLDLGTVTLPAGAVLAGSVLDPAGQPLAGAVVRIARGGALAARLSGAGEPVATELTTGADGHFEVNDLAAGEAVSLAVEREGYAARTLGGLRAPSAEPVRIVLSPASRVGGRVLDEAGSPVAAAQVVLRRLAGAPGSPGLAAGRTDREGRFSISPVAPGRFALSASAKDHLPAPEQRVEVSAGSDLSRLELTLGDGSTIEGEVTIPDGGPAVGAEVRLADPALGLAPAPTARTGGDGRYRLSGIPSGRHSVVAELPGYRKAAGDLEVDADGGRLDLRLGEAYDVAGRAVDGRGEGLSGVRLAMTGGDGGARETASGPDGSFRFAGLGSGRYRLNAEKEGYAARTAEVEVAGAPLDGLEVRLDRGAAVSGRIAGLSFADLARVEIAAAQNGVPGERPGATDDQGRYRVADLAPGDWVVSARLPDGRVARGTVAVPPGVAEVALDLAFESGLTLTGRVVAAGAPVAGAVVSLQGSEGGGGSVSGPQGEFQIAGLKPGTYHLLVLQPRNGRSHGEPLELAEDREIVVDLAPARP